MKSNSEWLAWGKLDPLFAVASLGGKSKSGEQPWEVDEFFRLGTEDWAMFLPHWESFGLSRGSCLEIGCGAGRMTRAMAAYFNELYALDISPDMIAQARHYIPAPSVKFVLADGSKLPLPDNAVEGVFSTHVFQHLDSIEEGKAYFGEVFRVLAPGGTAMIHLPTVVYPGGPFRRLHRRLHAAQKRLGGIRATVNRSLMRLGVRKKPIMRVTSYELTWLEETLRGLGFAGVEMRVIFGGQMASILKYHTFLLFRKPAVEEPLP